MGKENDNIGICSKMFLYVFVQHFNITLLSLQKFSEKSENISKIQDHEPKTLLKANQM